MEDRIYAMLGLCMKAGKLAYGSDMCEEKIKAGKVSVLIVAEDASENTKNKFKDLCNGKTPIFIWGEKDKISHCIGKENKALLGVLDSNLGKKVMELVKELKGANNSWEK